MQIEKFKSDFKRLNGVYATDKVVLLRDPLELSALQPARPLPRLRTLTKLWRLRLRARPLSSAFPHGRKSRFLWSAAAEAAAPAWAFPAAGPLLAVVVVVTTQLTISPPE